ncbi:hypothetical protein VD0004_g3083 [Verticillium dahliae]|nr:hypothetical protein VD0004_g3083 [Verticillium dahliae]PNH76920.1 hypothetical protein VD0001_g643 [Verticillium dahliae]
MAGFVQAGDLINFGRLAWQVYQYGWQDEHNATRQYFEFGRDVKGLAENLNILSRVLAQANQSLREQGAYNTPVRWDEASLLEIIGDYRKTLQECYELVETNTRYRLSSGPVRNIEWNVLVQPNADRLRQRLLLHNSKVLLVLKPFEIDLLCRVHQDLADRIQAVHVDLRRLIGILVPNMEQALAQQEVRDIHMLDIPPRVSEAFRRAAMQEKLEYEDDMSLDLEEMADAFVLHYGNSTRDFVSGMLVENRVPHPEQYINLLKCVWLMQRIRESPKLKQPAPESHWPSYVKQLEDDLSSQCERFEPKQELVAPDVMSLTRDMLEIWPEKELPQLIDVVTRDELMEEVLEVPLNGTANNVQRNLQLLRRMGADNRRFRINLTGVEQPVAGRARRQAETIDFDISTVTINPLYAVPSPIGGMDVILRRDERIARLAFQNLKDVLKFQQAVTGFKTWASHVQFNALVSFIISGRRDPIVEKACIQLWIPKQLDGRLVTGADVAADASTSAPTEVPSRSSTLVASPMSGTLPFSSNNVDNIFTTTDPFGASSRVSTMRSPPSPNPAVQRNPPSAPQRHPINIPRRPVASGSAVYGSPPTPRQPSVTLSPFAGSPPASNAFPPGWSYAQSPPLGRSPARDSSISTVHSRTFSMSSNASVAAQSNTSSSGSDAHTVTVSIAGRTTGGTLHRRPPKPMLVLFTENPQTGKRSFVALPLDDENAVINPVRCHCGRAGRDGAACTIAALEKREGRVDLEARRFESTNGEADWNVAKLALGRREERGYDEAIWRNLRRLSIKFPDAASRAVFGGTPAQCRCSTRTEAELNRCLKQGHKGFLGEVQEWYRQRANQYHAARYESQQHVVNGTLSSQVPF